MWSDFSSIFILVFLAELGDKTQLATMNFAAGASSKWGSFLGASAALVVNSALAVFLGFLIVKFVGDDNKHYIEKFAGALFVILGVLMFMGWMPGGDK